MDSLTIAQLAQFSGIKPHTIRIWEQRYNALTPERSQGNVRYYSSLNLRRLLNIVSLMEANHKVSSLCKMQDEELNGLMKSVYDLENPAHPNIYIPQLIAAGMEFREVAFNEVLSYCFEKFGVVKAYKEVVYPLINRVGLMWSADMLPPAQEHFISNLIRQKILAAIDALPCPGIRNKKWILLLPEDEYHEIGLLFANYMLKLKGIQVVYLGTSVPVSTLNAAIDKLLPDNILLFFVHHDFTEKAQSFLNRIHQDEINGNIYVSGHGKMIDQLSLNDQQMWLRTIEDFEAVVHN